MAYNQGFYNLFLGIGAALGLLLFFGAQPAAGAALLLFSTASMLLAGCSRPRDRAICGRRWYRGAFR